MLARTQRLSVILAGKGGDTLPVRTGRDEAPASLDTDALRQRVQAKAGGAEGSEEAANSQQDGAEETEAVELKQRVGLTSGIAVLVGTIIGSGIFISPRGVTEGGGSVGMSLILWAVGGVVVLFGALSYAELGLLMPQSGGEYIYFLKTFGTAPAFIWVWTYAVLIKPCGVTVVAMTCARYILVSFYADECGPPPNRHIQMLAVALILLIAAINVYSVTLSARIQVIFTVAKVLALIIIIIGGLVKIGQGHTSILKSGFQGTNSNAGQIVTGLYSAMFAYDGWTGLNVLAEELVKPEKNMLRAFLIGLPMVTVIYILTNVSYFAVMSVDELLGSTAVAVTWAERVIPAARWIIPLSVALSSFGSGNGHVFTGGRYFFACAREGHIMQVLGMVHVQRSTPLPAVIFTGALSIIFVFPAAVQTLINFMQFSLWFFYALTMIVLFVLRVKLKDTPRRFKVPLVCPIIVLIFAVILVVVPVALNPRMEYLYAVLLILAGFIFYVPFVYFQIVPPFMGPTTSAIQMLTQISPTAGQVD